MRILFFSHYYAPEGNAPASRVTALTRRWAEQGHEVTVITCAPNVPSGKVYSGYKNKLYQTEFIDQVRVIRVWTYIAPNRGIVRRISNYLSYMFSALFVALFLSRPDVTIATSPQFFCGWAGVLFQFFKGGIFILEVRDIWPESISAVEAKMPNWLLKPIILMERIMYRRADHIVTVGSGYLEKLVERQVAREKVAVVMNGVDSDIFRPSECNKAFLESWGLKDKFVCSYIGTIGMACGLEVVLAAAARLKEMQRSDIAFLLVGDGAVREKLEAEARKRQLDNVVFAGLRPKKEMPEFIAASDVNLVHLRKTELFTTVMPSKIFECAGMQRPLIIGVQGFAEKFVTEAQAGIAIAPGNASALATAVGYLADHPEECKRLGENAYRNIALHYDRKQLADTYLELLSQWAH